VKKKITTSLNRLLFYVPEMPRPCVELSKDESRKEKKEGVPLGEKLPCFRRHVVQ